MPVFWHKPLGLEAEWIRVVVGVMVEGVHRDKDHLVAGERNVTQSVMKPEPKTRPDNWVPVTEADLRSVLDPLSGLIFAGDSNVCPSRLPIYDGESRMDLVLTPKGRKSFSTGGRISASPSAFSIPRAVPMLAPMQTTLSMAFQGSSAPSV